MSTINQFAKVFEKHVLVLVDKLKELSGKHEAIDVQIEVSLITLETICETSMGADVTGDEKGPKYVEGITCLNNQLQTRQRKPYLWPDFIYGYTSHGKAFYQSLKYVHEYTVDIINKRTEAKNKTSYAKNFPKVVENNSNIHKRKGDLSFIDILLDSYQSGDIDIDGIREEVDTFIFEGHETTSTAISFCLYYLGRHPEYLKTLQDEIDNAKGENTFKKIRNIQFLDFCLKEALRLYPPVLIIARELEEDSVIDGTLSTKTQTLLLTLQCYIKMKNTGKIH